LACYRQNRQSLGRQQDNPCSLNAFVRPVSIAEDRDQTWVLIGCNGDAGGLCDNR
jgi:hypothetical protein